MKISTLAISAVALIAAGSAFAADLPAKKAAPAAAPAATGCPAFGAGYFAIPGGDTCIKFSGFMRGFYNQGYDAAATAPVAFGSYFRLITEVKSNTDMGTLYGYARLNNGAVGRAFVDIAGVRAGLAQSNFSFYGLDFEERYNHDAYIQQNVLSYTASLGGSNSLTIGVEDQTGTANVSSTNAVAHTPDLVGNIRIANGPVTFHLSGASHQLSAYSANTSAAMGYASMAGVKYSQGDTTAFLTGTYAYGALGFLTNPAIGSKSNAGLGNATIAGATAVYDADKALAYINTGYVVGVAVKQNMDKMGSYAFGQANYLGVNDNANNVTYQVQSAEVGYSWTPVKNLQVIPSIALATVGGTSNYNGSASVARLNITRSF